MSQDWTPLDGNAAAGRLDQIFAADVTTATVRCGACSREGPLAELHLYGRNVGLVLRCPACGAVNLRMVETRSSINLDLSGLTSISLRFGDGR
jgi:uncharacterized Zn finger protein